MAVAITDNIAVADVTVTCGSDAIGFEPTYHAAVTKRLLGAGADVVGTTNWPHITEIITKAQSPSSLRFGWRGIEDRPDH
ncbi:hypothetical protein E2L06_17595 [Haloterrigena sp. H1]|nr:hypothetical protein E2L06_17595 [Haloterrigena sp. H1]